MYNNVSSIVLSLKIPEKKLSILSVLPLDVDILVSSEKKGKFGTHLLNLYLNFAEKIHTTQGRLQVMDVEYTWIL